MKIVFIPIDNRPVCCQMPKMIADINKNIELIIPPKNFLGSLTDTADVTRLFEWLKNTIIDADAVILPLDTIAYGGLIPSRRSFDSYEKIASRVENLMALIKRSTARIYAFSSIMRISNNNINQEEKDYWAQYGKQIFKYSYESDKYGSAQTDVPEDIIKDYLDTRKRNFEINKLYLKYQKTGLFETLIFSKDDCAEYGLNVKEAREIEEMGGQTKTGADEIPLTLLAKALRIPVNVHPIFTEPQEKYLISNYEDVSVEKSVLNQLELSGCNITDEKSADVLLFVNNFKNHQGEIVMKQTTDPYDGTWEKPSKPYFIADVRYANGSDNSFIDKLFEHDFDNNFYGYAGWNTTANSLGSAICTMKYTWDARLRNVCDETSFKKLEAVRFLDDWAYQANVRQELPEPDGTITDKMSKFEKVIMKKLDIDFFAEYSYPWNRLFEVEIELN